MVDAHLDAVSAAVTEMGGNLAKKLDDGLMALFGYPAAQENDSERAVRAALAMQRAVTELNRMNADASGPALAARIAIDSGVVVIDAAGEIFGDVPNIVTHVQPLAEPGAIVVTARVQRQVAGLFVAKERGSHQLEGVPEAVTLYGIVRATGGGYPRPNYQRLIARAVKALDRSTAESRQAVYERARNALVAELRFNRPKLLKADIARECLALEEAIRKVEAEAARKSRTETLLERRPATRMSSAASGSLRREHANPPPANLRWAGWPEVLPGAREREEEAPQYSATEQPVGSSDKFEPPLDLQHLNWVQYDARQERDLEPDSEPEDEQPLALMMRHTPAAPEEEYERTRRGGLAQLLVLLIILAGVVAAISWQWSSIAEFYKFLSHPGTKPQSQVSHQTPSAQSKFSGGVPHEQSTRQALGGQIRTD